MTHENSNPVTLNDNYFIFFPDELNKHSYERISAHQRVL